MRFVSVREFRTQGAALRQQLVQDQGIVLTANGQPVALVVSVDAENLEEELAALRRARARTALDRIRARAKAQGIDRLSIDEIDSVVAQTRAERRSRATGA